MFISQLVANIMRKQEEVDGRRGMIIFMGSLSSYASSTNRVEYCASKAAVSMLTKVYADRLASDKIYVYEIRPGVIKTSMTKPVVEKYNKMIADGQFPIARWGYPEDLAMAVSCLCDGKLLYSTGQIINVDGGFHIRKL
jgi:3-oxoacyl-[acyl-carrier protein] reductase